MNWRLLRLTTGLLLLVKTTNACFGGSCGLGGLGFGGFGGYGLAGFGPFGFPGSILHYVLKACLEGDCCP